MATLRDVAQRAGTSVSAVSAVLNTKGRHNIRVSQETRERICAVAAELGYTANPIARSLVTRKTGVLGLVFPYSSAFIDRNPFCTQVMSGVCEEVVRERYNLMLHTAIGDDWNATENNALMDPRVDGLILVLPNRESPIVERCQRQGFPCVTVVYQPHSEAICAINSDDFAGGKLATEHLLSLGHRRIAHLVGNLDVATTAGRRQGYLAALEAAGLSPDPALMVPAGFDWRNGYAAVEQLLERPAAQRPTALFAANDLCADGVLRALRERGVRVPEDMALVGYDDTWFATMTHPTLTSVYMPIYEMGMLAAKMLIALVEGREVTERQPVLPVRLSVRESSGASLSR